MFADDQHFDWTENNLFFEDIPNAQDRKRTAIFLGMKDMIIDAPVRFFNAGNATLS